MGHLQKASRLTKSDQNDGGWYIIEDKSKLRWLCTDTRTATFVEDL